MATLLNICEYKEFNHSKLLPIHALLHDDELLKSLGVNDPEIKRTFGQFRNSIKDEPNMYSRDTFEERRLISGPIGRYVPVYPSATYLNKVVRNSLFSDDNGEATHIDIDIAGCYPSLLAQWCMLNNVNAPTIIEYAENYDTMDKEFKSAVKNEIRQCIHDCKRAYRFEHLYVRQYAKEVESIFDNHLPKKYIDYATMKCGEQTDRINRTAMSYFLQDLEVSVMNVVMDCIVNTGGTIAMYAYDGVLIRKDKAGLNLKLPAIEQTVFEQTGFKISLIVKPYSDPFAHLWSTEYHLDKDVFMTVQSRLATIEFDNLELLETYCSIYFPKCFVKISSETSILVAYPDVERESRTIKYVLQKTADLSTLIQGYYIQPKLDKEGNVKKIEHLQRPFYKLVASSVVACRLRTFANTTFYPDMELTNQTYYNTYSGFRASIVPEVDMKLIQPILDHLDLISNHEKRTFDYIMKWLQTAWRNPTQKVGTAIVFYSKEQGTGKTSLPEHFFKAFIYGDELSLVVKGASKLVGRFSSCQRNKLFIVCNENSSEMSIHAVADIFKSLITDSNDDSEVKYKNFDSNIRSFCNFWMTTNNDWSIKFETTNRRYSCCIVPPDRIGDTEYFNNLYAHFNQTVADHFFTYIIRDYLADPKINVREALHTELEAQMKSHYYGATFEFCEHIHNCDAETFIETFGHPEMVRADDTLESHYYIRPFKSSKLFEMFMTWAKITNTKHSLTTIKFTKKMRELSETFDYITHLTKDRFHYFQIQLAEPFTIQDLRILK